MNSKAGPFWQSIAKIIIPSKTFFEISSIFSVKTENRTTESPWNLFYLFARMVHFKAWRNQECNIKCILIKWRLHHRGEMSKKILQSFTSIISLYRPFEVVKWFPTRAILVFIDRISSLNCDDTTKIVKHKSIKLYILHFTLYFTIILITYVGS